MKKTKIKDRRWMIQTLSALATNAYIPGFFSKPLSIYTGQLKNACVPGLNCYSCPGAVGACPIGGLQAVAGGYKHDFSFYVIGTMMVFGLFLGRVICGFLCLFGFIQDLLYKIPTPKIKVPHKADRVLRYLKYLILILVILLPVVLITRTIQTPAATFKLSDPYFCKWLCPAGTLEGGIPLVSSDQHLQQTVGFLFYWKLSLLGIILLASVFIHRPFCKYLCPLGAFYGLFSKVSLWRMVLDQDKCINCGKCERACPMNVAVRKDINVPECIRCGRCKKVCPTSAIRTVYGFRERPAPAEPMPEGSQTA